MKNSLPPCKFSQTGSALVLTMIMGGIALAILAGAMTWSANSAKLTHRSIQYTRSIAAAEAATEKVLSRITQDFLGGGEKLILERLSDYRQTVPNATDSSFWSDWEFNDTQDAGFTHVQLGMSSNYMVLAPPFSGLRGYVSTYTVASHARETSTPQNVVAGVLQEIELTLIPVFQHTMFSSGNMEISCGQPFTINGQVHANKTLYVEPDSDLTFESDVTAVVEILFRRHPDDKRGDPPGTPYGTEVHKGAWSFPVEPLTLPIGTNNTPEAIREIIHPPPSTESASSPMGRLRYYNNADMILVVSNTGISATSVKFSLPTPIPTNQLAVFVSTSGSFKDAREEKTIRPIDINIGNLTAWSLTNLNLRAALGSKDVSSVYVLDKRTFSSGNMGAVRVLNGRVLPSRGLTVATARPLYVQGHYNQTNTANLGTADTSTTRPASLVADAITVLSTNWKDSDSTKSLEYREAKPTTVNAAMLTGVVETTLGHYSGGMENFPRFLEKWGEDNILTYNGSMVKMFPSLYATNVWGKDDVYDPPKRNWAYDVNFNNPAKLPPLTPSLQKVSRGQWATVAPDKNVATAVP